MNSLISKIRKKQDEIIVMVNTAFDEIVKQVSELNPAEETVNSEYDMLYPITNASGLKGKKITAVILNGKREIAPTWKKAVEIILTDAIKDENKKNRMCNLRDRLLGRTRTRLSYSFEGMTSPLKLDKDLYLETHYDTESLMKLLLQILNEISYDYSDVKIAIKN